MKCAVRERKSGREANNLVYFFSFEPVIHTIEGKQTNEEISERDKLITSYVSKLARTPSCKH
jgi:hypothetical protein